jgi:surfeit locus 1 family protein
MGARRIGILDRPDGKPVLVDLGWVPAGRTVAAPAAEMTVQGYVHPGDTASWFSAADDLGGRHFHTLDPARIAAALGVADALPFVIVALGPTPADRWPDPAKHLPRPPNNHLIYAVTWYGFAVTLVVIFILWARKAIRS